MTVLPSAARSFSTGAYLGTKRLLKFFMAQDVESEFLRARILRALRMVCTNHFISAVTGGFSTTKMDSGC